MDTESLRKTLLDLDQPLPRRTHAAFHLRTQNTIESMSAICDAVKQRNDSSLMRHELAYILGQMQKKEAIPILKEILTDVNDDVLVRHEAAEAMGAIGDPESIGILEHYSNDPAPEVSDTCKLAVDLLKWQMQEKLSDTPSLSAFQSIDPAPPSETSQSVSTLRQELLDTSLSLFQRYRAMFALRDLNSDEAALALVDAFGDDSALLKHEVAYVLGQMQRAVSVPGLSKILQRHSEHRMVRHEAAEALGSIGTEDAKDALKPFLEDKEAVVRESCDVALDVADYWDGFNA